MCIATPHNSFSHYYKFPELWVKILIKVKVLNVLHVLYNDSVNEMKEWFLPYKWNHMPSTAINTGSKTASDWHNFSNWQHYGFPVSSLSEQISLHLNNVSIFGKYFFLPYWTCHICQKMTDYHDSSEWIKCRTRNLWQTLTTWIGYLMNASRWYILLFTCLYSFHQIIQYSWF